MKLSKEALEFLIRAFGPESTIGVPAGQARHVVEIQEACMAEYKHRQEAATHEGVNARLAELKR